MYIRKKTHIKDDKRHDYWVLVESYGTDRGPRQRTVAWLGELDKAGGLSIANAAKGTHSHARYLFTSTETIMAIKVKLRSV